MIFIYKRKIMAKNRNRMNEPWGYRDDNNYIGAETFCKGNADKYFAEVSYNKDDNKIHFSNKDGDEVGSVDVGEFEESGDIVERAWYEDGKIYIKFTNGNLVTIDVRELIDENEFKDGLQDNDGVVSVLVDPSAERWLTVSASGVKVSGIQDEMDRLEELTNSETERATSAETAFNSKIDDEIQAINDSIASEVSARESGDTALDNKMTALEDAVNSKADKTDIEDMATKSWVSEQGYLTEHQSLDDYAKTADVNDALALKADKADIEDMATKAWVSEQGYLTEHQSLDDYAKTADVNDALALKADSATVYTQEEVNTLIKAKETEIYNLTKLVGEIGGNVTYTYPNELGTSLTSLLGNYGTVKLGEDATITRYGPGVTAKNTVTLNLNNHNLTSTAASSYGAIMARGTQQITIGGKGTIDAGDGICIEANGTATLDPIATINLTGSTTTYRTNRPGGELIYCYVGTINITNGIFRNDGESNYTLNCYDVNYQNGTAKIIVTGGKFYDFNPADNSAEGEHTSFVPEGYHVETSTVVEDEVEHTIYTVKKD